MAKVWIGNFYPASKMYQGEEGKTVGVPMLSDEVANNRHNLKGLMNGYGLQAIGRVKRLIKNKVGLDVNLYFSQKAGCGSCPCSPGYMIKVELPDNKSEAVRDLFSKWGGLHGYTKNRSIYGVREVGISLWGNVKAGKVKIGSYGMKDETDKAVKIIRKTIKEK